METVIAQLSTRSVDALKIATGVEIESLRQTQIKVI